MGHVPSKKNAYRRQNNGGMYRRKDVVQDIDSLSAQIPAWTKNLRLEHAHISVRLTVGDGRADRDNKVTTLLDILVRAGVLRNDSIARCNGRIFVHEAVISPEEGESTLIRIKVNRADKRGKVNFDREVERSWRSGE
jgi:hypothetical protein